MRRAIDSDHLSAKTTTHPFILSPLGMKTAKHRKLAALGESLGDKALSLVFALFVVPEFASVVEFKPRTFQLQALSIAIVSEQAAFTTRPTARKVKGKLREQFLKHRLCHSFAKLQKTPDFNFTFTS